MTPRSAAIEYRIWLCRTDIKPCDVAVESDATQQCRWYDIHGGGCTCRLARRIGKKLRRDNGKKS